MRSSKRFLAALPALSVLLAGCASTASYLTPRHTTVEMYHIFDVQTTARASVIGKAAADGLSRNTNELTIHLPLQMGAVVPETPGRFAMVDASQKSAGSGGGLLQLMALQARGTVRMVNCPGAVWTVRAERRVANSDMLNLEGCLYPYQKGYHLNLYARFDKQQGGILQLSRDLASSVVGKPEEWVNKTILDMVRAIRATEAQVVYLEGQPELGAEPALFTKPQQ